MYVLTGLYHWLVLRVESSGRPFIVNLPFHEEGDAETAWMMIYNYYRKEAAQGHLASLVAFRRIPPPPLMAAYLLVEAKTYAEAVALAQTELRRRDPGQEDVRPLTDLPRVGGDD